MKSPNTKDSFKNELPSGFSTEKDTYVFGNVINLSEKQNLAKNNNIYPQGKKILNCLISESHDKDKVLEKINDYTLNLDISSRIKSLIDLSSDEIIMNAFFNAPMMGGKFMYKNIDRKQNVFSPKPVSVSLIDQTDELVLCVKDSYGSLNVEQLISKINNNLKSEEYMFPSEGSGAGIGLSFLVLKNISLIIRVIPNVSSEFILFFPKKSIYKDFSKNGKIIAINNFSKNEA